MGSGGIELHSLGSRNNNRDSERRLAAKANSIGFSSPLPVFHYVNSTTGETTNLK